MVFSSKSIFLKYKSETKKIADNWKKENKTEKEVEEVVNGLGEQIHNRSKLIEDLEVLITLQRVEDLKVFLRLSCEIWGILLQIS